MLTDKEENLKLRKPFEGLLEYMNDRLQNGMEDDGPDGMCEHNVYFGFGTDSVKHMAKIYVCPETYEILEEACHHILEYIDEEYPATEPIGRIVKSYEIIYTGGGIYILYGFLNDGRFMCGEMPDDNGGCINVIRVTDEEAKALHKCMKSDDYTDDIIDEVTNRVDGDGNEFICSDNSKWMLMWKEVLDDYVKTDKHHAEKWMNAVYEEVAR